MFRKKKKSLRQRRLRRRVRLEPLESRRLLAADCLQNTALPEDVNADDLITVRDALIVIEDLLTRESEGESVGSQFYTDVNGDHVVTSLDALHVIQSLIVGKSLMASDDGPTHDANDDSRTGIDDSPGSDDLVA
ncbi:MAG TPA: chloroperoxidase, partial [Planctomycetaceae bacterium]|nr:chloroperoxidase [Planctomycetaceae bacterium]